MAATAPSFQRNVMETNDLSQTDKRSSIIAIAITFLASAAVGRATDPIIAYFMFLVGAVLAASLHPKWNAIRDYPAWKISNIWRPIGQSLVIGLTVMFILVVCFGWSFSSGSAGEKAALIFVAAVLGPFVEESIRWIWLQILPLSIILSNGLWVLAHPSVARMFRGEAPDLLFAGAAFIFGLMMTAIMWVYESPDVPGRLGFGPMAAVTYHGVFNGIAIAFSMSVAGVTFTAFWAWGMLIVAGLTLAALTWRTWRCGRLKVPRKVYSCA